MHEKYYVGAQSVFNCDYKPQPKWSIFVFITNIQNICDLTGWEENILGVLYCRSQYCTIWHKKQQHIKCESKNVN